MRLKPTMTDVTAEYVLVQAWKKTSAYLRQHNWFADTLELDHVASDLPSFLADLSQQLADVENWRSDPLRLVPAPKSQKWAVNQKTDRWSPVGGGGAVKLRPLAHASIKDQVAATALMLCLADRVETMQGDPRDRIAITDTVRTMSYGNRLFCDSEGGDLVHRWGSGRLYRSYFSDYRAFLERPQRVCEAIAGSEPHILIVQSDLSRFYDRVRPSLLHQAIEKLRVSQDDPKFFALAAKVLNWSWHQKDLLQVRELSDPDDKFEFTSIALPQGLVSAGFWSNIVLQSFDQSLMQKIGDTLIPGVRLWDASRYVDDLRIVVSTQSVPSIPEVQRATIDMLQSLLDRESSGLLVSESKTEAAVFRGEERPIVRQSRRMARVQAAVPGGFDIAGGEEIIEAIQGLVRTQQKLSINEAATTFMPVPDVADATVARFAAGRFRTTYRSLRPLLSDYRAANPGGDLLDEEDDTGVEPLEQSDLDDAARVFAFELVQSWIEDPANVRLLRIALDIWPDIAVLRNVLSLIRPYTVGASRGRARRVALYCLAEIFRAGATETALVDDDEKLSGALDVTAYRGLLSEEASRVLELSQSALPWYVKQQAYLFLAAYNPGAAIIHKFGSNQETKLYRTMTRFLTGATSNESAVEYAKLAMVARRSFLDAAKACELVVNTIDERRFAQIAKRDPGFAWELIPRLPPSMEIPQAIRYDLALDRPHTRGAEGFVSLADIVLSGGAESLRTDLGVATLSSAFATWLNAVSVAPEVIVPAQVLVRLTSNGRSVVELDVISLGQSGAASNYLPPSWALDGQRWRFQLGYLIRFLLTGRVDFTLSVQNAVRQDRRDGYRPTTSHWLQRHYSLYNGHESFGDDWLPISSEVEQYLYSLLIWPGCRADPSAENLDTSIEKALPYIIRMAATAETRVARGTQVLMLPLPRPAVPFLTDDRPLRGCVVQTVVPEGGTFKTDIEMSLPQNRRRHRRHLSSALAAVVKMLDLRETHKPKDGRLDWLILPELSVHPLDVQTHLVPFARKYRTTILAGLTYERLKPGGPLVNSAYWVIPTFSPSGGLTTILRRQGKANLAKGEQRLNDPVKRIDGFRPCQWLVPYPYSPNRRDDPLWLTGSICYDATDLQLAADLRDRSDVYAIPALNKDVGTFDQMAAALHYHMFQMVIVANNGAFGGSNAYAPRGEPHERQIFHTHGQPQATVSFFELDNLREFKDRKAAGISGSNGWKYPPAGL